MQREEVYNGILMFKFKDLHKLMYNKANKLFCKEGMPLAVEQLPVLMVLFYRGTMSQQEIADILERDKSSVLRSIKSLQTKSLISVAQDPFDKRKKMIKLTDEGHTIGVSINKKVVEIDKAMFAYFTEEEKKQMEHLIQKCSEGINKI